MRITRIQIENFRNFHNLDMHVGEHAVIVGANRVGKSNLLYALRLVLDPTLSESARLLRPEDFWDGLPRPLRKEDRILISVDLADVMEEAKHAAHLSDALIVPDQGLARLTYEYLPHPTLTGDPIRGSDYTFRVYKGNHPARPFTADVRRRLPLDVLPALRDAEDALGDWRRSPLRPLLDEAAAVVPRSEIEAIADQVQQVTASLAGHAAIADVATAITERLRAMVGDAQATAVQLGVAPNDPDRLVRALRLFIDNQKRGLSEASVGSANLLLIALRQLELDLLVRQHARDHTFFAIEEPEAHLHPHLQRLVYRDYLRPRQHLTTHAANGGTGAGSTVPATASPHATSGLLAWEPAGSTTKLLTTHSPHIVSVTPIRSLVLLRQARAEVATVAVSTARLVLTPRDEADLERYLDVTRGEMIFARGVILVEGEAEMYLLPTIGRVHGYDFDTLGITVCSVGGIHFAPFLKLLGPQGLDIPFAVVTDGDPDETGALAGATRLARLFPLAGSCGPTADDCPAVTSQEFLPAVKARGLFLGDHTLEVDLYRAGQHGSMTTVLQDLGEAATARARAAAWAESPGSMVADQLLADIKAIGKGRFAQQLASCFAGSACPDYILGAIASVAERTR